MAVKIKKGDHVMIIAGSDKGRRGKVIRCDKNRVLVEGVNIVKRHTRANPQRGVEGGIVEKEATIHISNVALFDSNQKPSRVGFRILKDGRKVRYFKTNNETVDV